MNLNWSKEWLANFNNVDEMMKEYQHDVFFEDLTLGIQFRSREEVRSFFAAFGEPNAGKHKFVGNRYTGTEDAGTVEWIWIADHEQEFLGHPAAGMHTEIPGVSILTFRDGKIVTQIDLWDSGAAFKQLNALKAPFA